MSQRPVQIYLFIHVGAVGNHNAHGHAEREKQLAHSIQKNLQKPGRCNSIEVWNQVDSHTLQSSPDNAVISFVFQSERKQADTDDHQEQTRHDNAGKLFNALFYSTVYNESRESQKYQHEENGRYRRGNEAGKVSVSSGLGSAASEIDCQIFQDPAADHRVISHNNGRNQKGYIS